MRLLQLILVLLALVGATPVFAVTISSATTTLTLSICGNALVDGGEECDVPGEVGVYSTTIAGRQCTPECDFGPYCGDTILQTQFGEECDDGNNDDGDFCSSECTIEPAGSGGGGTAGGGGGGSGGSNRDLGDTEVRVVGQAYPLQTVNILIDTESVGTVRTDSQGDFEFSTGTATLGIWATDSEGTRSITFNSTFDVTQGAITNVNGVILPPTIRVPNQNVDPGDQVPVSGQSIPDAALEVHVNNSQLVLDTRSNADGEWSVNLDTSQIAVAEHTLRARSITGTPPLTTESGFSTSLQLFVGVDGRPTTASDLNREFFGGKQMVVTQIRQPILTKTVT
jgi:cysteine-rich repeat protein